VRFASPPLCTPDGRRSHRGASGLAWREDSAASLLGSSVYGRGTADPPISGSFLGDPGVETTRGPHEDGRPGLSPRSTTGVPEPRVESATARGQIATFAGWSGRAWWKTIRLSTPKRG
jgi:hypothetical protein